MLNNLETPSPNKSPKALWIITINKTMSPDFAIFSAFAPIIPEIIKIIASDEINGKIDFDFSIFSGLSFFAKIPIKTGINITVTTDLNMARIDTSTHLPAKRYTKNGVTIGARSVDKIVIETDIETFPPAMWVITFDAVPPGQHPTRIIPKAMSLFTLKAIAKNHAIKGIIVNCAKDPIKTSLGFFKISLNLIL